MVRPRRGIITFSQYIRKDHLEVFMKIEFYGGAGTVTGSSYLITAGGRKVLLDCGLYQGSDARKRGNDTFPFDPAAVEYLILSHAHIDHSGRIPMLYKHGFRGKILSTPPTYDLCRIMLKDSAYIQEQDAERDNRKLQRKRQPLVEPIYTVRDAEKSLELFEVLDYEVMKEIWPELKVRFQDAGHMLGSSFVELWLKTDDGEDVKLVFSGDIGNHNIPLMREPRYVDEADIVIMESTYGDRLHEPQENENHHFIDLINSTMKAGGNVVIPSFAVGRTQEILYVLNEASEKGQLEKGMRVFVDSPLASKATAVFDKNARYFDRHAQERIEKGDNVLEFPELHFTESVEDSKKLNNTRSGLVIISASGMAEAGRIRHHLKHNLWRPESTVIFVGYQAPQTLGDIILSGKEKIKIFGEEIAVEARIERLYGLSGHADKKGLIQFAEAFTKGKPKKVFLVHGDEEARRELGIALQTRGFEVEIPDEGTVQVIRTLDDLSTPTKTTIITREEIMGVTALKNSLKSAVAEMNVDRMTDDEIIARIRKVLKAGRPGQ